jgi:hypothetical protein
LQLESSAEALKAAESRASAAEASFVANMAEYDKVNNQNELDRIRGYISSHDTRFPIGTIERLKNREEELKKLGAHIT